MSISTTVKMELNNGQIVTLTANFGALLRLSSKNKKAYDRYNQLSNGIKNELEFVELLYYYYLAANTEDECMDMMEFFDNVPTSREELTAIYEQLSPKKKTGSPAHFGKGQKRHKTR